MIKPDSINKDYLNYPKRFVADAMLGSLARWLRALGYDTVYIKDVPDKVIVTCAIRENRTILTRDHHFEKMKAVKYMILVKSTHLTRQFQQIVQMMNLNTTDYMFTRCVECNTLLEDVDKTDIRNQVPPYVYKTMDNFSRCPACDRVFWAGTHLAQMQHKIYTMLISTRQ